MLADSTLQSFWTKPLLPCEPRIFNYSAQQALTERFLLPHVAQLERYLLAIRTELDLTLSASQPMKLGKPYPLGQCLEIALAVQQRLRDIERSEVPPNVMAGFDVLRTFQRNGGTFRLVWGDLRRQYFQNAFQLGTLYVDVSNDTVVPTKPKVEILPFEDADLIPIRDFEHFKLVATRYWQDDVYPNHVIPSLAPYCPLLHIGKDGAIRMHNASQYMISLTQASAFEPSESILRAPPMPEALFNAIQAVYADTPLQVARNPAQGRHEALLYCQKYRAKRWHLNENSFERIIDDVQLANRQLAQYQITKLTKEKPMEKIEIDDVEYDIASLNAEAKAQLQSIQFVDQELARLQAQTAALQTARNAYIAALKNALPGKTADQQGTEH